MLMKHIKMLVNSTFPHNFTTIVSIPLSQFQWITLYILTMYFLSCSSNLEKHEKCAKIKACYSSAIPVLYFLCNSPKHVIYGTEYTSLLHIYALDSVGAGESLK